MNLKDIRLKFVEISGRQDLLASDEESDNGANFYIQAGQRLLDRSVEPVVLADNRTQTLSTGEYLLSVANLISVNKIYILDSDDGLIEIEKSTKEEIMRDYPKYASNSGTPVYWAFAVRDRASRSNKRIMFNLLTDADISIVIDGMFGDTLTDDDDTSFWSSQYPELLIYAACYQMEVFYRNSEGMRDWMNAMNTILDAVDWDFNMEQIEVGMQMSEVM